MAVKSATHQFQVSLVNLVLLHTMMRAFDKLFILGTVRLASSLHPICRRPVSDMGTIRRRDPKSYGGGGLKSWGKLMKALVGGGVSVPNPFLAGEVAGRGRGPGHDFSEWKLQLHVQS